MPKELPPSDSLQENHKLNFFSVAIVDSWWFLETAEPFQCHLCLDRSMETQMGGLAFGWLYCLFLSFKFFSFLLCKPQFRKHHMQMISRRIKQLLAFRNTNATNGAFFFQL